jgi:hypothetical protein
MKHYYQNKIFIQLWAELESGLNHNIMTENKEWIFMTTDTINFINFARLNSIISYTVTLGEIQQTVRSIHHSKENY